MPEPPFCHFCRVGLIPYKKYEKDPPVTEGQNGTPKTEGHKAPPKTEGPKDPPRTEGHNGPPKTEGQNGTPETDGQELSPETVREKRKSALLAGFFSVVWGGVTAYGIAFLLDVIIFRPLESEGFLGVLYTAAFAAIAALPLSKVLPKFFPGAVSKVFAEIEKEGKVGEFAKFYALAVGGLTMLANLNTSPDLFRTVDSLIFFVFVLLPTGVSAAREAWECAADGPQVHEGFYELYDPTGDANKMPTTDTKETPKNDANETPDKDTNNMPKKEHSFPRVSAASKTLLFGRVVRFSGWKRC